MSVPVIMLSLPLCAYWFSRTWLLLHGSPEVIAKTLDNDFRWGQRCLLVFW